MPSLVRKLDNLVLNGRAIARTDSLDLAAVERRPWNRLANHAVRGFVGVGDMARNSWAIDLLGEERKRSRLGIAMLWLEAVPIDAASIQTPPSPRLQALPVPAQV